MSTNIFYPPKAVREEAKKGLALREKAPPSKKAGTRVGLARANQLAREDPVSIETIKRMVSFFARHEGNEEGEDPFDRGRQAWLLWGGNAGRTWANAILNSWKKEQESKNGYG